jgi:nitrate reductase NapE component
MTIVATVRPDSWESPLLVHVLGAMILVGGLLAGVSSLALARGDVKFLRLGYWSLLAVALPGWLLMRIGAEWIASREGWTAKGVPTPTWLSIGFILADAGGLILLVSLIVGGIGVRRLRAGQGAALLRTTLVLSVALLGAYVVAVWAMAGKPS